MKPTLTLAGLLASAFLLLARPLLASDAAAARQVFADPPRGYASGPLWVWNDRLTEAQIRGTLRDLAGQRVKQAFVHPRPGLMTPYLSDEWFQLWKVALDEAAKLDMNIWIYDENSYPSGFAGGWVPELMPESRGQGLQLRESRTPPAANDSLVRVLRLADDPAAPAENVTARVKAGEALPEGRYVTASLLKAGNSPWHGNRCYVNLLTPGVTEKFLEVTLDAYKRELGGEFGKRIPGAFTDEPNIRPAGGLPWCADLPEQFQKRWGYDLLDHLPSLTLEVGDWRRVRHNYFSLLNTLFIERWGRPYYEWCERNGLEFTGHYWDHEWPHCVGVPDNMAMAAWQHRPGIDCLMNQYSETTHAQFGNVRFCREISSIANQLGRARTFVELYGAGGWDLRFEDMKRIADWLQVLGINTMDEHLSYVTLRGARKRDHPQSFSYHEPWWEAYHVHAQYMTRLSAALSQGEQINRLLVLEPTTTAWMYQGNEPRLKELGDGFFQLLMALEAAQIEYDLGDEDVIARHGALLPAANGEPARLQIGRRTYTTVVIPPLAENLDARTRELLKPDSGLRLLGGQLAGLRTDGRANDPAPAGADWGALVRDGYGNGPLLADIRKAARTPDFEIKRADGDRGILFHHRRHLDDGELLLLVNTSIEAPSRGTLTATAKGLESWNLYTGRPEPYACQPAGDQVQAAFDLPPSGSLLLFLSTQPLASPAPATLKTNTLAATGRLSVQRLEPNVFTLDYVDVTAAGESRTNLYFYQANQFVWKQHGMERNPWDSAVQYKDELIAKTFPADSGFSVNYRFVIEGAVPPQLSITIERADLYTVTCNGQPVKARPNAWWLDKAFPTIDLTAAARTGENVVTLTARPFTILHEIEPAYVRGEFRLKPVDRGFVITPDEPLQAGGADQAWDRQGHPFYSGAVAYRQSFQVERKGARAVVRLGDWRGSVARVRVNGDLAGYITAPPWQLDVSNETVAGANEVEVAVIGTLKNTLGPHHNHPSLGTAWPGMFQQGPKEGQPPGREYSTVGYGLFAPFTFEQLQSP